MQTHWPEVASHTDPGTVPLGSQTQGTQPRDPSPGARTGTVDVCYQGLIFHFIKWNDRRYPGGSGCCCRSRGHSRCTRTPPPRLCTGTVRSERRTPRPARRRGRHRHKGDSPGSSAAPACGNHGDRRHRDDLPRAPEGGRNRGVR